VLGLQGAHGGAEYEMLMSEGQLVLQLHHWDAHEHPHMGDQNIKPYGNGLLLWFETDDFNAMLGRAKMHNARVLAGPLFNPNARHRELWLEDPNGYKVVVASRMGDLGGMSA
jgi:hypothetical protein